ncbi:MAG: hypothetical protein JST91_26555 [Actinobacteria bacterium]|nr:hypothetical protein [Actinomycetota bacterium]
MSYELRPVVGMKNLKGDGYPTFDEIGNVTLPDTGKTIPPTEYHWVKVTSEASPDMSKAAASSLLISPPSGQQ